MPYCPKCDMEFIDGITICSDCGGSLAESEEAAKNAITSAKISGEFEQEESPYEYSVASLPTDRTNETETAFVRSKVYVKKSQKYEDLKSSASAFLLVGTCLLIFSLLCWLHIIRLPMNEISKLLFQTVLTLIGLISLAVSIKTSKTAKGMTSEIATENEITQKLILWFTESYTGKDLDQQLSDEFDCLSPEELTLKRFDFIQDILLTHHDITDQSYADALSEEIYAKIYE